MEEFTSEQILEAVLRGVTDGISIQTFDRKIIFQNASMSSLLGNFTGKRCFHRWKFLREKTEMCVDCPAKQALSNHTVCRTIRRTKTPKNEEIIIEITTSPIIKNKKRSSAFIQPPLIQPKYELLKLKFK